MTGIVKELNKSNDKVDTSGLTSKLVRLKTLLKKYLNDGIVLAFSGGVDSAFLLFEAERVRSDSGGKLLALTTKSASMPQLDYEDATQFATSLGVKHVLKNSNELDQPEYTRNDLSRCYYCKNELFRVAERVAKEWKYKWIMYGYNASDRGDIRPGHKAAVEHGVLFPLADIGFTKDEIRQVMAKHGITLSEKPASPCLSSRIMHGIPVTPKKLQDIEHIELILHQGGLKIYRVRLCAEKNMGFNFLRIEVDPEEIPKVLTLREKIVDEGRKRGYRWVTLDLAGYRTGGGTGRT